VNSLGTSRLWQRAREGRDPGFLWVRFFGSMYSLGNRWFSVNERHSTGQRTGNIPRCGPQQCWASTHFGK
jgi:hypothetical protein